MGRYDGPDPPPPKLLYLYFKYFGVFARLVKFHQLVLQLVAARLVSLYEKDPIELGTKYDG